MRPDISCIICTYRRDGELRRALESLTRQTFAPDRFEVLVVDNDGSDDTAAVVRSYMPRFSRLRYLREGRLGLCCARNRGFEEADADVVAFLDDDAMARPEWLTALVDGFQAPSTYAIGGPAELEWPHEPPDWLTRRYWGWLSYVNRGPASKPLQFPAAPFGLNMAFRRAVLIELGGFPVFLDRSGQNLAVNGESAVFWEMERRGLTVMYEPGARVVHIVPPERMKREFFRRRVEAQGVSDAIFDVRVRQRTAFRTRLKLLRLLVTVAVGVGYHFPARPFWSDRFSAEILRRYRRGYLSGLRDSSAIQKPERTYAFAPHTALSK